MGAKSRAEHPFWGGRLNGVGVVVSLFFCAIAFRLWYLQCIQGAYYRDLSENNRTRTVRSAAARGNIYDRNDNIIVQNRPEFNIAIMLEDAPDVKAAINALAEILGHNVGDLENQLARFKKHQPFVPQVVLSDVTQEQLARVKVNTYRLPGVSVEVTPTRAYPNHAVATQLLGYAREISKGQLTEIDPFAARYRMGDVVGQSGLERQFESRLSGAHGYRQVEVDAMGNRKGELGIVDSRSGDDLYLTIDLELQRIADQALAGKRGAVVVLDPNNGEILALASAPSFDGNLFSGDMSADEWRRVSTDSAHPLRNRAVAEIYPAGSTFKLILATAGLAERKITRGTTFHCPGYFMFAGRPYHCHKRSGHGMVDLPTAMTVSCNSYFYQLGQLLGIESIHRYATMLGLGVATEIELPGEKRGVIPSEEWKRATFGQRWYPGETISVAIGQGYVAVTPLQMAVAIATIANGGTVYQPQLVRKIIRSADGGIEQNEPRVLRKLPIESEVFKTVREVAVEVVNDKRGTGTKAAFEEILVGGKTGTAQVTGLGRGTGAEHDDHAWFVAFAPAEAPQIALAVIVENGGHGGATSAPISKLIMESFFRKKGLLPPVQLASQSGVAQQ